MQSTQSAQPWLFTGPAPSDDLIPTSSRPEVPARERDARLEIDRLREEIEALVRAKDETPRDKVDSALESVTRLQIVTANIDACGPPPESAAGAILVALADGHLMGHSDAIERGMTYTSDNQLRLLKGEQ